MVVTAGEWGVCAAGWVVGGARISPMVVEACVSNETSSARRRGNPNSLERWGRGSRTWRRTRAVRGLLALPQEPVNDADQLVFATQIMMIRSGDFYLP